jgi:DMSO reductase anchor subunit
LRRLVQVLTFAIPAVAAVLMIAYDSNAFGMLLSFITLMFAGAGVLFERWLFFAEAEHTVSLYYN